MNFQDKISVTVHSLLYILNKIGGESDFHKLFKILYFAEREHLSIYGNLITENGYIAMNNGPVPSLAYDILKSVRGNILLENHKDSFSPYFEITDRYKVKSKIKADLDEFSKSELTCLDNSILEYSKKSFSELTNVSHDSAWENSSFEMDIFDIAKSGGAKNEMLRYIEILKEVETSSYV